MKKLLLVLVLLLAAAQIAIASEPAEDGFIVADFADAEALTIFDYHHAEDEAKVSVVSQGLYGENALSFTFRVDRQQAAFGIRPAAEQVWDGSDYSYISVWIKGDGSTWGYRFEPTDFGGERFEILGEISHEGWQQVKLPISNLDSRTWQPGDATVNHQLAWPLRDIRFVVTSGSGTILVDLFEFLP